MIAMVDSLWHTLTSYLHFNSFIVRDFFVQIGNFLFRSLTIRTIMIKVYISSLAETGRRVVQNLQFL
jgi:hypothetical protein